MDAMREAAKFLADKHVVWTQPALREIIEGLVKVVKYERLEHERELRDTLNGIRITNGRK